MTDGNPRSSGDDAFGGAVGDDLPGRQHEEAEPAAPGGWPGEDERGHRPTSPAHSHASAAAARAAYADAPKGSDPARKSATTEQPEPAGDADGQHPDTVLATELRQDLQRLQAEYVNYKRRVDRDRDVAKQRAVAGVVEAMLPVLDEVHLARQHGELEGGPFAKIAEKLEAILGKYGVQRYGQPGDAFDPMVHEAVMHTQAELAPGTTTTTVVQVMQPGYKIGDHVVRAALVAVADPT